MSELSQRDPERKLQVVLAVLSCEVTMAEAARGEGVSATTVKNWKNAFLEAGHAALAGSARHRSSREQDLATQCHQLTVALGEAHLKLWISENEAE